MEWEHNKNTEKRTKTKTQTMQSEFYSTKAVPGPDLAGGRPGAQPGA